MRGVRSFIFSALIIVCGAMPLQAAQSDAVLQAYKTYNQALAHQDFERADAAAEKAWRGAEAELGDDKLTAILAYNLAWLRVLRSRDGAVEPARRAHELLASTPEAGIDPVDMELVLGVALERSGERAGTRHIKTGLAWLAANGLAENAVSGLARLEFAQALFNDGKYSDSTEQVQAVLDAPAAVNGPLLFRARHQMMLLRMIDDDLEESDRWYHLALESLPEEATRFNSAKKADLKAWHGALEALVLSKQESYSSTPHLRKNEHKEAKDAWERFHVDYPVKASSEDKDDSCGDIEWIKRKLPTYRQRQLSKSRVGALIYGYDIQADGHLTNIRRLAAVPAGVFEKNIGNVMEDWVAEPPDTQDCRIDRSTLHLFSVALVRPFFNFLIHASTKQFRPYE